MEKTVAQPRVHFTDVSSSGRRVRSHAFDGLHPSVAAVFFGCAIVLTSCSFHPILCAVSLGLGLVFGCIARGIVPVTKSLLWAVPLLLLVAVLNPFFSAQGSSEIAHAFGRPFYAESLVYGACMGAAMASMLVWVQNATAVITAEDVLALVGKSAPTVALMLSMVARLVPSYLQKGNDIAAIQQANTAAGTSPIRRFTTLIGSSLESSLNTADSMAARGWNSQTRRTTYRRICFTERDGRALAVVAILALLAACSAWRICTGFTFYPTLAPLHNAWPGLFVCFAAFLATPIMLEGWEVLKWTR